MFLDPFVMIIFYHVSVDVAPHTQALVFKHGMQTLTLCNKSCSIFDSFFLVHYFNKVWLLSMSFFLPRSQNTSKHCTLMQKVLNVSVCRHSKLSGQFINSELLMFASWCIKLDYNPHLCFGVNDSDLGSVEVTQGCITITKCTIYLLLIYLNMGLLFTGTETTIWKPSDLLSLPANWWTGSSHR